MRGRTRPSGRISRIPLAGSSWRGSLSWSIPLRGEPQMAHQITVVNGKASMAYAGAVPWHGLGQSLTPGQPIEVWLQEAGMDYTVLRSLVRYSPDGTFDSELDYEDRF